MQRSKSGPNSQYSAGRPQTPQYSTLTGAGLSAAIAGRHTASARRGGMNAPARLGESTTARGLVSGEFAPPLRWCSRGGFDSALPDSDRMRFFLPFSEVKLEREKKEKKIGEELHWAGPSWVDGPGLYLGLLGG